MSFHLNKAQQMAIHDSLYNLTEREMKHLMSSWAETFSKKIFPFIEEDRFSVLYSDNPASRPNNPVNVYFGLLILREIFNQSDEEALNSLMFDIRYQHALHTTSFPEQPVSKNSLTNFRAAVYSYNQEHGVDLIQEEIESHAAQFSKLLKIEGKTIRMDSLIVSSSCKKLSRLEIIYSTVKRFIKEIDKDIPENFKPYLEEDHYNNAIYRSRDKDLNSKIKRVLKHGLKLYSLYRKNKEISKTEEFKLLGRMLKEQTQKSKNSNGDKFEIDEKEHLVKKYPSGHKPVYSAFKKGSYRAHFNQKHCHFPLRKDCSVVKQKKSYLFKVSETKLHRPRLITNIGTSEYQELASKRAGIKGVFSVPRRRYRVDHLPVRGLVRVKVCLGFKISAINCKRLIKGLINRPIPELFTFLYNHLFSLFGFQRTYRVKFAA